jgi:hypothetical protein
VARKQGLGTEYPSLNQSGDLTSLRKSEWNCQSETVRSRGSYFVASETADYLWHLGKALHTGEDGTSECGENFYWTDTERVSLSADDSGEVVVLRGPLRASAMGRECLVASMCVPEHLVLETYGFKIINLRGS